MTDDLHKGANTDNFILFSVGDGRVQTQCRFEGDTLWLPQATIAELFQVTPQAITQHIRSVYEDVELDERSTCEDYGSSFAQQTSVSVRLRH
ncbi:DNA-binding protein [Aliidiomarina sanyensis]|uniref:DNA-binding protein n=1 Tax=Aliidiomarina sanyensis TaxID=1249555 RepID=A0A432WBK2_9GAMM|nr:DNA-binding protein [Aliidiomarina sanyensis]